MAVQVLQFTARWGRPSDWTQQELAEFYRVENALLQAGLRLESERGVTDEGEPWFVFCHQETGEVFIHFARIDGQYVIDGASHTGVARSRDFKALVRDLISSDFMTLSRPKPRGTNVFLHPAALLIALVGSAFFHSSKADAAEAHDKGQVRRQGFGLNLFGSAASERLPLGLDPVQTAAVMAGVIIGLDSQRALPAAMSPAPLRSDGLAMLYQLAVAAAQDLPGPSPSAPADGGRAAGVAAADVQTAKIILMSALAAAAPPPPPAASYVPETISIPTGPSSALATAPVAGLPTAAQANTARSFLLGAVQTNVLPDDEAAEVVQAASNGDHHFLQLNGRLPTLIVDLIGRGTHVVADGSTSATAVDPSPGATGATPVAPPTSGSVQPQATSGGDAVSTPAPTSAEIPHTPTAAVPTPTETAPAPPPSAPVETTPVAAVPPPAQTTTPSPEPAHTSTDSAPTPVAPAPPSEPTPPVAPAPAPVGAAPTSPAPTPAPATSPQPQASPPASPPVATPGAGLDLSQHPHDPAIDKAIAAFMAEASHWEVVVTGHDLVIYDTQIFGHLPTDTTLDSLTFSFSDGSSVSLVGTSAEINNLYHLGS